MSNNDNVNENFNINTLNYLLKEVNTLVRKPIRNNKMQDPKTAISSVVGALEGAIQKTSIELKNSTEEAERLQREITSKETEINTLRNEIVNLRREHETALNGLKTSSSSNKNTAIKNLRKNHAKSLQNKNNAFALEKQSFNQQISTFTTQIKDKQYSLFQLSEQKIALEQQKYELTEKVRKYESQIKQAGIIILELQKKVKEYNTSYKALEKQITNIYSKYSNGNTLLTNSNSIISKAIGYAYGGVKKRVISKSTLKKKSVMKKKQTKSKKTKSVKTKSVKTKSVKRIKK